MLLNLCYMCCCEELNIICWILLNLLVKIWIMWCCKFKWTILNWYSLNFSVNLSYGVFSFLLRDLYVYLLLGILSKLEKSISIKKYVSLITGQISCDHHVISNANQLMNLLNARTFVIEPVLYVLLWRIKCYLLDVIEPISEAVMM